MKQTVHNGVIVFTVAITRWSANKKLRLQHTKAKEDELPPSDLASLGVRKVFDPKALAPFEAIRKEVERLSFNEGTSFFGGVAVAKAEADDFALKLKKLQDRFSSEKDSFIQKYESTLNAWKQAHPGWEHTIEGALSAEEAANRFSFSFNAVEIVMADEEGEPGAVQTTLQQNIASSKGAFIGQVFTEIATMATNYRKDSLLGKERATARGLSAVTLMRKKLNGLSFLDKRIRPLTEMIDKVLAEMPPSGAIEGAQYAALLGVTSILADQEAMQQYGEQVNSGKDPDALFNKFVVPAPTATPQQAAPVEAPAETQKPEVPVFNVVPSAPEQPSPTQPAVATKPSGWGNLRPRAVSAAQA